MTETSEIITAVSNHLSALEENEESWISKYPDLRNFYLQHKSIVRKSLRKHEKNLVPIEGNRKPIKPRSDEDEDFLKDIGGSGMLDLFWQIEFEGKINVRNRATRLTLLRELDEWWEDYSNQLQQAVNTAEKIDILQNALSVAEHCVEEYPNNTLCEMCLIKATTVLEHHENLLKMERENTPPTAPENTDGYKRVVEIFEKQRFWAGSLTDFVYVMDRLAVKGHLVSNDLDEALAETFAHKPKGNKKIQPLTAEKIKNRRRNMRTGTYTESDQIRGTMSIIENKLDSTKSS
ncbi:MAG TPA: hypothetical protein VFO76_12870 [Candidatus Kapabacteria bacterium]|nr:hypothetical protein [Candidatus Kapabacteria bacterium]